MLNKEHFDYLLERLDVQDKIILKLVEYVEELDESKENKKSKEWIQAEIRRVEEMKRFLMMPPPFLRQQPSVIVL